MLEIQKSLDELVHVIEKSETLARYQKAKTQLQKYPEKEHRVQEFRVKNYKLHQSTENIDVLTESNVLKKEYADIYNDPMVREFLDAEVAVCKILQIINREVVAVIDFEDVLMEEESKKGQV